MIDHVTIQNACLPLNNNSPTITKIKSFNIPGKMNGNCSICPSGNLPIVRISSTLKDSKNVTPQAAKLVNENAIHPANLRNLSKINRHGLLGLQVCFEKAPDDGPLIVNFHSFKMTSSEADAAMQTHTITVTNSNFANIELEK